MIWDRRRRVEDIKPPAPATNSFADVLKGAPVMALLIHASQGVIDANDAARAFFEIEPSRLPASLVEVTLEGRLIEVLASDQSNTEVNLVHHRRIVSCNLVPGPRPGETLMFLTDVTELRRLETVRQEFVANLVHELKTPLTSLRLAAESLIGDPAPNDRQRFAERVVKEADLLTKIIDNLRQLGEIEAKSIALVATQFDVSELVREAVARLGIDRPMNTDINAGLTMRTDRAKLVQALDNLLDNAAKFSPPGTPIDIHALLEGNEVRISVRDHGPGISPEHWRRVFERFYKVDRARPREAGGFGLGLAITKHLVQVLGGRIWTEAARDGGQVFTIALPLDS